LLVVAVVLAELVLEGLVQVLEVLAALVEVVMGSRIYQVL